MEGEGSSLPSSYMTKAENIIKYSINDSWLVAGLCVRIAYRRAWDGYWKSLIRMQARKQIRLNVARRICVFRLWLCVHWPAMSTWVFACRERLLSSPHNGGVSGELYQRAWLFLGGLWGHRGPVQRAPTTDKMWLYFHKRVGTFWLSVLCVCVCVCGWVRQKWQRACEKVKRAETSSQHASLYRWAATLSDRWKGNGECRGDDKV